MVIRTGVIGHPIGHSLSPQMHRRWIERFDLDASYEAVDGGDEAGFRRLVTEARDQGWAGMNVTLPFKVAALALADEPSARAAQVGAANLLIFKEKAIYADNTDVTGFTQAVRHAPWPVKYDRALVLGAGGAAPAIVAGLEELGFTAIRITNRTEAKSLEIVNRFDSASIVPWENREAALQDTDLLVNSTSLGMKGQPALPLSIEALPDHAAVVDIVTTPLETPLLAAARRRGLHGMNGVPMLVHQAIPSFAAWFGHQPDDADEMVAYLEAALGDRT